MRNFLKKPTQNKILESPLTQKQTQPSLNKVQYTKITEKTENSNSPKQKIANNRNDRHSVPFEQVQDIAENIQKSESVTLDRSYFNESVSGQNVAAANEMYEIPIPILIVLVGSAKQYKQENKDIAMNKSKKLQNCRKTIKQLLMRLFIEECNNSYRQNSLLSSKLSKENYNKKNILPKQSQISINQIIDHITQLYQNTQQNQQNIVPKQFYFCNFLIKFTIHLFISQQQIQQNKYNHHLDKWKQLNIPKIIIMMYHASKKQNQLLLSKFIKDTQYLYKKKKNQDFDFNFIQRLTQKKNINQLVMAIIVVDRSITINNYKNIQDWVSFQEGIQLAKKNNLLYMEIDNDGKQESNPAINMLVIASLIKLNEFGVTEEIRGEIEALQEYLVKHEKLCNNKENKLIQSLMVKQTKILLTLLNRIQQINGKIEQLVLNERVVQQFIVDSCYLFKYNIKSEEDKSKLFILDNLPIIIKKQQQNLKNKFNHLQVINQVFKKIYSWKLASQRNVDDDNITNYFVESNYSRFMNKMDDLVDAFTQNIILQLINNKEEWFQQNMKGQFKVYIEQLLNFNYNKTEQKPNFNVIVEQVIKMVKNKMQELRLQNNDDKKIYNKFKQKIKYINTIIENQLNIQNDSIQMIKFNNFNNSYILQLSDQLSKQNNIKNNIKQINISQHIKQSINYLFDCLNNSYLNTKQYHNVIKQQILSKIQWKFHVKLCLFNQIQSIYQYTLVILQEINRHYINQNAQLNQYNCNNKQKVINQCQIKTNIDQDDQILNQYLVEFYLVKNSEELKYKNEAMLQKYRNKSMKKEKEQQQVDSFIQDYQVIVTKNNNEDKQMIQNLSIIYRQYLQKIVKILNSIQKQKIHKQLIKYKYLTNLNNLLNLTRETKKKELSHIIHKYKKKKKNELAKSKINIFNLLINKKQTKKSSGTPKANGSDFRLSGIFGIHFNDDVLDNQNKNKFGNSEKFNDGCQEDDDNINQNGKKKIILCSIKELL